MREGRWGMELPSSRFGGVTKETRISCGIGRPSCSLSSKPLDGPTVSAIQQGFRGLNREALIL
jgi:hypothetical protein